MTTALVTGGSGYVGSRLIVELLKVGHEVRATVRSQAKADELRELLSRGEVDQSALEIALCDLAADDGWATAAQGCEEVFHVASPFPMFHKGAEDELIRPALEGTLRVLRAARDAGARRVVLTSSFAAIGYGHKDPADYSEADWTDPQTPGLAAYPKSKTIAERAAWEFIAEEGGGLEMVSVNPTFILGPTLTTHLGTSMLFVKGILEGTMSTVPRQRFGVADVRDVVDVQIAAMAVPEAAGHRFLVLADGPTVTYLEVAELLIAQLGERAQGMAISEMPGDELAPLVIHNDAAQEILGWRPRPLATTVADTATDLIERGLVTLP